MGVELLDGWWALPGYPVSKLRNTIGRVWEIDRE